MGLWWGSQPDSLLIHQGVPKEEPGSNPEGVRLAGKSDSALTLRGRRESRQTVVMWYFFFFLLTQFPEGAGRILVET